MGVFNPREDEMDKSDEKDWTLPVPVAGKRYYGLGKNASYAAAARGEIPTLRIGGKIRAVVHAIEHQLGGVGQFAPAKAQIEPEHE